jgi:CubicO group peptidase (beta-lactamase class C family)
VRLGRQIDAVVGAEVQPEGPGAIIAVLRDGELLHCKGYGLANLEWNIPVSPETVFRIASLTKQFTAIAVMMLRARGLLSLDDPIERFLVDFPPRGRRVTIRHLLNHTSGIRTFNYFERQSERARTTLAALLEVIYELPFDFEPGDRYVYNNSGYVLLGGVIEAVSGQKYRDFLRTALFEPLGMRRTGYLFDEQVTPFRASGYERVRYEFRNARFRSATWAHAAGALGSTVGDLAKWDRAIRHHQLIDEESFNQMLEPARLNDGSTFPYGFGWGVAEYCGRRLYHHAGGGSGFAAHMLHFRDEDLTTILLSNLYLFPFDRITRAVARAALGEGRVERSYFESTPAHRAACAGTFTAEGWPDVVFPASVAPTSARVGAPRFIAFAEGQFYDAGDPEIEYRFGDRRDGVYYRLDYASPLWPVQTFRRARTD